MQPEKKGVNIDPKQSTGERERETRRKEIEQLLSQKKISFENNIMEETYSNTFPQSTRLNTLMRPHVSILS